MKDTIDSINLRNKSLRKSFIKFTEKDTLQKKDQRKDKKDKFD